MIFLRTASGCDCRIIIEREQFKADRARDKIAELRMYAAPSWHRSLRLWFQRRRMRGAKRKVEAARLRLMAMVI